MKIAIIFTALLFVSPVYGGECKDHAVIYGIDYYMKEFGLSEGRAASYRVNLWDSPKRNSVVGKLMPGTHARILDIKNSHYQVKAPKGQGGAVGWISEVQVEKIVSQDTENNKLCE